MGIQRIEATAPRARQPAVEELSELAGSRAPPKIPQRQRGLWSFLTWPFVIAPIIAAESFLAGSNHAVASEDQDDRAAGHGSGLPNAPLGHDQAVASAARASDDVQADNADVRSHSAGSLPKPSHATDTSHEEHAKTPPTHDAATVATALPPVDGGGADSSSESSSSTDNSPSPDSGGSVGAGSIAGNPGLVHTVTDGLAHTVTGVVSTITNDVSDVLAPVGLGGLIGTAGIVQDVAGGLVHTVTDGVAPAVTGVVSTITSEVSDVVAPVGLGGLTGTVDLKNLLGFDLHVSPNGEFAATDLGAALDQAPLLPLANTASHVASPVLDGLPVLNYGTSNALDGLFGTDGHPAAGDALNGLPSILGNVAGGSSDAPSPLQDAPSPPLQSVLTASGTAATDKLAGAILTPSLDDSTNPLLPLAGGASDPAHVSIMGAATPITPGHSLDFPAPAPAEANVLFNGNSYTDYHVALQTTGPSVTSSMVDPALTSVTSVTPDAAALVHVDTPAPNPVVPSATAPTLPHPDASLTHLATTVDDLSLRIQTH
jgi:hypothetical protein